jgi:class 3 adenylate cyclase/tetratricopeptide (TPR) repeat protein
MNRLEKWLRRHKLAALTELLRSHDVTLDILLDLTQQDLRELGLSLGVRRKLEHAIRTDPPTTASVRSSQSEQTRLASAADRRQLTVMFVDLVGSTALSRKLDPEDLRQVIRDYQNTVVGEIAHYQGHIAQFLGDGVLCYFGWPVAYEFGAERAVRAGLDVVRAVSSMPVPSEKQLAVRIGIATGLVVVGEMMGEGKPQEPMVSGEAPNLAARLQQHTPSNTILIAAETRRILGNAFLFERIDLGFTKGFEAGIEAFRVLREAGGASRFEQRHGAAIPAIVGRDQEIELLRARWNQAKRGKGQGVLLVGEPGIGKSRILRVLIDELRGEAHQRIEAQCSPYYLDRPLWPIAEHLRIAFAIRPSQPAAEQLGRLERSLRDLGVALEEAVPLNAALLDIAAPSYVDLALSPQQKRNRTLQTLNHQLLLLAKRNPTLLVLEDAHWVDPTTLELLEIILQSVMQAPVLVVVTSRPENSPNFSAHPHVTQLSLNRLGRESVELIVKRTAAGEHISHEFVTDIVARSDGMPLFAEELTKALVETRQMEPAQPTSGAAAFIPPTLYDSLMARLDRIPEVKELAQTAACIGREFDFRTLAAIAGMRHGALLRALDRLVEAELLFRRGVPPEATYSFKHALVRDAAYESQLRKRRRKVHEAIVWALEKSSASTHPELVAQHAVQAGQVYKAMTLYLQAGQHALERFANKEALQNLKNAFRLLETLPHSPDRDRQELAIRLKLGLPLIATSGYASEEVETHYRSTVRLSQRLSDSDAEFTSTRSLWNCAYDRANLQWSFDLSNRLVQLADASANDEKRALAFRALGSTLMNRAEFAKADEVFDKCVAVAADLPPATWIKVHGEVPPVVAQQYKGFVCAVRGRPNEALRLTRSAVESAERLGHPLTLAFARAIHAHVLMIRRDYADCLEMGEETFKLCTAHGFVFWAAHTEILEGVAMANLDRSEEGLERAEHGLKNWIANGAQLHIPTWSALIAEAALFLERYERAGELLIHATRVSDRTGDFFARAELERLHGRLLLVAGKRSDGQSSLERALALARCQGATLFELRAAMDLAEMFVRNSDSRPARDVLAPIVETYREHREGEDYRLSIALLDKIAASKLSMQSDA